MITKKTMEEKEQIGKLSIRNKKIMYLTTAGIMAALITLMTAYVCHIPIGVNGGYIHFGDSLIYLAAVLLPTPYALAAAAIGGGLADLLTAPMWAPATIIIKMLLALLFANKSNKIVTFRNVIVAVPAAIITIGGYYLAEFILFGAWPVPISMLQNLIQSVGSTIFFVIFGLALDKTHLKTRFFGEN